MEYEDFADNSTTDFVHEYETSFLVVLEINFVLSFVCLAANSLIVFLIFKYKRLRNRRSNIIILNASICNAIFNIFGATAIRIEFHLNSVISFNIFQCLSEELCYSFLLGNVLFVLLLQHYWFIEKHKPVTFTKLERHLMFFILFVYSIVAFCLGIHILGCLHPFFFGSLAFVFLVLGFLAYFLYTIILYITDFIKTKLNKVSRPNRDVNVWFTTIFFLSYMPLLITSILVPVFRGHHVIVLIVMTLSLCNPLYNLLLLCVMDRDFKLFFLHTITCKCNEYGSELKEERMTYLNEDQKGTNGTEINI